MTPEQKSAIRAMINLECLGVSPPKVWATRADKELLSDYFKIESALGVARDAVNVEKVGDDDSHPFLAAGIPVLTIHSLTQQTWPILHSERDNLKAIHPDDYYTAYRLAAAYLAYVDGALK
jgi:Iap family predicted aminopeptidase